MNLFPIIIGVALGGAISFVIVRINKNYKAELERRSQEILKKAKEESEELLKEAKSKTAEIKANAKEENEYLEKQLASLKRTLKFKGDLLDKREKRNDRISAVINQAKTEIRKDRKEMEDYEDQIMEKLRGKTKMTDEEAKKKIFEKFDHELELEQAKLIQKVEEEVEEDSPIIAKNLLKTVIQRITSASSVDKNSTAIPIKNDKFKGLLIGKGASNIEYLESLVPECDVIFNLEPNVIYAGGLNLVQRNVVKKAIQKLKKEKRSIDHKKIKRAVDAAKAEMDKLIMKAGKEAIKKAGIKKHFPDELIRLVGRLKYRTSFGQNVLQHSIEMAGAAAILAAEINADVEKAVEATFFHDIGKSIDHDVGGSHDVLTKEILEKYNFDPDVVHAAYAHHDAEPQQTPEAMIVKAADAISAGRPGARQESLTSYLERINKLEDVTKEFEGVKKSFAISAGREVRVIVDEEEMKDVDLSKLAKAAAEKIEDELTYPGKIKVNVIRTTKATDYAK